MQAGSWRLEMSSSALLVLMSFITWQVSEGLLKKERALRFADGLINKVGPTDPSIKSIGEFLRTGIASTPEPPER